MESKKSKFHGFLILIVFLLLVVSSCKKTTQDIEEATNNQTDFASINKSLLDDKYCQIDDDCVVTEHKKSDCCSECFIESINKEANLERKEWEQQNCGQEDYQLCPSGKCSITPDQLVGVCKNNECKIAEIRGIRDIGKGIVVYEEPWNIKNPKIPNVSKPDDFLSCEKDVDCIATRFGEDSCCTRCSYPINKQGHLYLEEWHNQNCKNVMSDVCPVYTCSPISEIKCENKKCIGIPSKT